MDFEALFSNFTEEQMAKAKACKTPKELLELAGSEGINLTDEQMEALSGGAWFNEYRPSDRLF